MSHFSEVKTKIKDREILKKALKNLGHEIVEGVNSAGVEVRGYFGSTQEADFKILTSTHYDIGFKENHEGCYELVGDWELLPKVSGINQEEFSKSLKREYAHQMIRSVADQLGYTVEYEGNKVENENGEIEITVKQWG